MPRHSLLTLVALFVAGAFAAGVDAEVPAHSKHSSAMSECARACADCMQQCESCAKHCADLAASGKKETLETLGNCADCADFCSAAARIVSHRGPMTHSMCEACAKACDTCAAACEKYPQDEHMARCTKACRECARACREMLKHGTAEKK